MIRYPSIKEYNQAAQTPSKAFVDPELSTGTLATSGLGLPIVLGGGFALTYTVTSKARKFAVRCFHRYVPDLKQRYAQISDVIGGLESDHFVTFEYQREGVRVTSGSYPVVKMAWAEGSTLGAYIEDNYDDAAAMRSLAASFRDLSRFLSDRGIAHGDLENGNLVVRNNGRLTLIDYDGMYVPGMALGDGNEIGHAHFQHPGRTRDHFGPRIDDFSFILLDISLTALAHDPSLYERFCDGDNILFHKSDFENPATSPVFKELRQFPDLKDKVDAFATICKKPIDQVPALEDFLANRTAPRSGVASAGSVSSPRHRPAGQSNVDFLRAALNKTPSTAKPGPAQHAAQGTLAAKSMIPEAGVGPNKTSAFQESEGSVWPGWVTITVFGVILLFVAKSLIPL